MFKSFVAVVNCTFFNSMTNINNCVGCKYCKGINYDGKEVNCNYKGKGISNN